MRQLRNKAQGCCQDAKATTTEVSLQIKHRVAPVCGSGCTCRLGRVILAAWRDVVRFLPEVTSVAPPRQRAGPYFLCTGGVLGRGFNFGTMGRGTGCASHAAPAMPHWPCHKPAMTPWQSPQPASHRAAKPGTAGPPRPPWPKGCDGRAKLTGIAPHLIETAINHEGPAVHLHLAGRCSRIAIMTDLVIDRINDSRQARRTSRVRFTAHPHQGDQAKGL